MPYGVHQRWVHHAKHSWWNWISWSAESWVPNSCEIGTSGCLTGLLRERDRILFTDSIIASSLLAASLRLADLGDAYEPRLPLPLDSALGSAEASVISTTSVGESFPPALVSDHLTDDNSPRSVCWEHYIFWAWLGQHSWPHRAPTWLRDDNPS